MVTAFQEKVRTYYKIKEGIDGSDLTFAEYLFKEVETLEEPICYILDSYQEDKYKMQGYLYCLQNFFDLAEKQGIIEIVV